MSRLSLSGTRVCQIAFELEGLLLQLVMSAFRLVAFYGVFFLFCFAALIAARDLQEVEADSDTAVNCVAEVSSCLLFWTHSRLYIGRFLQYGGEGLLPGPAVPWISYWSLCAHLSLHGGATYNCGVSVALRAVALIIFVFSRTLFC